MILQDNRTAEQKKSHSCLIVGTDSFLSGWGMAEGGVSYAAWACPPEWERSVMERVEGRSDMRRVRVVYGEWRPKGRGHAHIYVVTEKHAYAPHWTKAATV